MQRLKVSNIQLGDRRRVDYGDMGEFIQSIKSIGGLIHPITVKDNGDDTYTLLAGGRRLKAYQQMKEELIPVTIWEHDPTPLETKIIELTENVHRKDMTWEEEIKAKEEIHNLQTEVHGKRLPGPGDKGWGQTDTAAYLGESSVNLGRDLKLAAALEVIPTLRKCKTKADATKMLDKMVSTVQNAKLAKAVMQKMESRPPQDRKVGLINGYLLGDFREIAKELPDSVVGFVDFDPPWPIKLEETTLIRDRMPIDMGGYHEPTKEEYPEFLVSMLRACHRVMRANAWMVVWTGSEPELQFMTYRALVECGFWVSAVPCIWNKGRKGQCRMMDRYLSNSFELFLYARKGTPAIVNTGRSNVFEFKPPLPMNRTKDSRSRIQHAEKPIELMEEIISTFVRPGALIAVPCAGSGNTLLAGSNLGCPGYGCDVSQEFKDRYVLRVQGGEPGKYKTYVGGEQ